MSNIWKKYKLSEKYIRKVINEFLFFEVYFGITLLITVSIFLIMIKNSILEGIIFGLLGFIFMMTLWDILTITAKNKLNEQFTLVVSTFAGLYAIKNNVLMALKETCDFIKDPIKSIILNNIYLYEKGQITYEEIYKRISDEINIKNYINFFSILYYAEESGANLRYILSRLVESTSQKLTVYAQLKGAVITGIGQIFFMIIITIYMVINALNSQQIAEQLYKSPLLLVLPLISYANAIRAIKELVGNLEWKQWIMQ